MIYTMQITCDVPNDHGYAITQYDAKAVSGNVSITGSNTSPSITLTNIEGEVSYSVRMSATSIQGQGAWSDPVIMLMPNEPGAVSNVTLAIDSNVSPMSATITFDLGSDGGTPLTGYQVTDLTNMNYYNPPPVLAGTPIVIEIDKPLVTTDYQIEIAAANAVGTSAYTQSNTVTVTI